MPDTLSMLEPLKQVLQRELDGFRQLEDCQQLTAGASQETFCVRTETGKGELKLALRRSQPALAAESVPGQMS